MSSNVKALFFAQALVMCTMPLMIYSAALATRNFAPSLEWTTLPVAAVIVSLASFVYPAAHLTARWGRKRVFLVAMLAGSAFAILAMFALIRESFWLFILAWWWGKPVISHEYQYRIRFY